MADAAPGRQGINLNLASGRQMATACLILALVFAVIPVFHQRAEGTVDRRDLVSLGGTVQSVRHVAPVAAMPHGRSGEAASFHVVVAVPDRNPYADDFAQDDAIIATAPGLLKLGAGDAVTMLVEDHGADSRLWELTRDGTTLLRYDDTRQYIEQTYANHYAWWARALALLLFATSIIVWFFAGDWSQQDDQEADEADLIGPSPRYAAQMELESAVASAGSDASPAAVPEPPAAVAITAPALDATKLAAAAAQPVSSQPPYNVEAAVAPAGKPQDGAVVPAATSTTIPAALDAAAHAQDHAVSVLVALLLDGSADVRARQEERVRQHLGEAALLDANAFVPQIAQLTPMLRLPLAASAFPVLRKRPRPELATTIACLDALVRADGKLNLFEYCVGCMLHRQLAESLDPTASWKAGRQKLLDVQDEIAVLLAVIAQNGAGPAAEAQRAYDAGMQHVLSDTKSAYLPPAAGFVALDQAWTALGGLDDIGKTLLVEGMLATIGPDERMTVAQSQLLRTVCAVLDCRLPSTPSGS